MLHYFTAEINLKLHNISFVYLLIYIPTHLRDTFCHALEIGPGYSKLNTCSYELTC